MIFKGTATFQILFIVSLFCASNIITTVEINSGVYLKVKFVKCFCLLPVVLVLILVLLFWSWSCKQRSWAWSCYFGLDLKNLVLFTSLLKTSSPRPMTQKGIIWHNAKCARKDNVTHYVFSQYMAHSNVHCVMYCSALYNGYVKCSAVQYSGLNTKTRTTHFRSQDGLEIKPMSRLSRPHHCDGVDDMSYVGNQLNLRSWRLLGFFDNFLALDANGTDSLSTR